MDKPQVLGVGNQIRKRPQFYRGRGLVFFLSKPPRGGEGERFQVSTPVSPTNPEYRGSQSKKMVRGGMGKSGASVVGLPVPCSAPETPLLLGGFWGEKKGPFWRFWGGAPWDRRGAQGSPWVFCFFFFTNDRGGGSFFFFLRGPLEGDWGSGPSFPIEFPGAATLSLVGLADLCQGVERMVGD